MPFPPIDIAIVDDHALFRKTLKNFLCEQPNFHVTIQASNIFELLEKLRGSSVEILLMDIFMPEMNGDEALKILRQEFPAVRILVLSMNTDIGLVGDMLDGGIHGYISKFDEPEELLRGITSVAEGRIYRNKFFTEALYLNKQNNIRTFGNETCASLNERDVKILRLIWEEMSNKEIADELFLGVRSVEKIRQDMKEKLGVKSTVGLLKYAISKRLIEVNTRNCRVIR